MARRIPFRPGALLEEARALGELMKQGWKPRRTIIYCAWDGEEPRLLGSTEWAEEHDEELRAARRGLHQYRRQRPRLSGHGRSHTLENFMNGVARDIEDPETKLIGLEAAAPARESNRPRPPKTGRKLRQRSDLRIGGSGFRLGLHGFHRPPGHRLAQPGLRRRRRAAASITPCTTISIGTRTLPTPISSMAGRWRKRSAPR